MLCGAFKFYFKMKKEKVKVIIKIGGDKRKGSCWSKVVTGIDNTKKDRYMFIGEFLKEGEVLLEEGAVILQVETHGSWKNKQFLAFLGMVDSDGNINWQDDFNGINWQLKKVSIAEKCSELILNNEEIRMVDFDKITYQITHQQFLHLLVTFTNDCGWYSKMVIIKKNEFDFLKYPFHSDCHELFSEEDYDSLLELCQEDEMITVTEEFYSKKELFKLIQNEMNIIEAQNDNLLSEYYEDMKYQNLELLLKILQQSS